MTANVRNYVYGKDMPPSVSDEDWTVIANLTSTSYVASQSGVPEVGVAFIAPTSGQALLILGAGLRNNAATSDRAVVTYRLYEDSASGNQTVLAAADNAIISCGTASSQEYQYMCTYDLLQGLTPGRQYYAQVAYRCTGGSTADIASRSITIIPMP